MLFKVFTAAVAFTSATVSAAVLNKTDTVVNQTTCNGANYQYNELAGYGFIASNARDKFGDTIGGIGSSIALEKGFRKIGSKYTGFLWAVPDRGWNTQGTLNYQNRVHKFLVTFDPTAKGPNTNLNLRYVDTVLLFGPDFKPTTGLDADATGFLSYPGFPPLPAATYPGDGYGGPGYGDKRISIDAEGLVLGADGSFWISDEYGPYIYRFNRAGLMTAAIRPPDAFIPLRNGTQSFASVNNPVFDPNRTVTPTDVTAGRNNNQGFEGLTISPDGKTLTVLIQSALAQDGGSSSRNRFNARLLQYSLTSSKPTLTAEYVVPLPQYTNNNDNVRVASQSEILQVSATQFFVLSRDSNSGRAAEFTTSHYRHIDVFDLAPATNFLGQYDATNQSIAGTNGRLVPGITPATYCSFLDFNVNSELAKFGLRNGGDNSASLLNEKWEGLALFPVNDGKDGQYYTIAFSDNDFITTDGHLRFGSFDYSDKADVDNQVLVFRTTLPAGAGPRPL